MDVEVRLYNPIGRNDIGLPRVISLPSWASPLSLRRRYAELLAGAVRGISDRVLAIRARTEAGAEASAAEGKSGPEGADGGPGSLLEEAEVFARSIVLMPSTNSKCVPVGIGKLKLPVDEEDITLGQAIGESCADNVSPDFNTSGLGLKLVRLLFDADVRTNLLDA